VGQQASILQHTLITLKGFRSLKYVLLQLQFKLVINEFPSYPKGKAKFFSVRLRPLNMTETFGKHVPYGAPGSGFYSLNTVGCFNVISQATDEVRTEIARILHINPKTVQFNIGDMGCADGYVMVIFQFADDIEYSGTSILLWKNVIGLIRNEFKLQVPIVVFYEDQMGNDWKSVFNVSQNSSQVLKIKSYLEEFENGLHYDLTLSFLFWYGSLCFRKRNFVLRAMFSSKFNAFDLFSHGNALAQQDSSPS
jgi:hypothetical protein